MKKKCLMFIFLIVLFLISILFLFFSSKKTNEDIIDKNNYSQIYLYDLGNSEIEIIIKDDFVILINTGLEKDKENLLDYLDRFGIEEIDYLILTNKNDKYIGNASYIIENFMVDYVYLNDYVYDSKSMDELSNVLLDNYVEEIILTSTENIRIDSLKIDIYPYMEDDFKMEDKTLIVNIYEGDNSIYLTSNASNKRIDEVKKSTLLVSENKDILDKESEYYIYDGEDKIKKNNLIKRDKEIYINEKELIIK